MPGMAFTPASPKRVRKAIKRFREKAEANCEQGELLRRLIRGGDTNVVSLRPSEVERARHVLINAGRAYCMARCGGCPLTEGYVPP